MKKVVCIIVAILAALVLWPESSIRLGPGVVAPDAPTQSEPVRSLFRFRNFTLEPVAAFEIEARVLARKSYWMDDEAALSSLDLALGWGRMSDESILDSIDISQGGRFYRWRVDSFPIPRREIETHSANMHLIPATATVEDSLDDVRPGQVIMLRGHLVNAEGENGWRWKSSTTRSDTGAGACELVFVETVEIRRGS